jgi:hypothetical protein
MTAHGWRTIERIAFALALGASTAYLKSGEISLRALCAEVLTLQSDQYAAAVPQETTP